MLKKKIIDLDLNPINLDRNRYIDRDFSWLAFNFRVLEEVMDKNIPLLERIKYLAIVANNLDEFFEVRISHLFQIVESGVSQNGIAEMDSATKLKDILKLCKNMIKQEYKCWNKLLLPSLNKNQIFVKRFKDLNKEEKSFVHSYFQNEVYHLLTPIKVDPAHPFPWVGNKVLCLLVALKDEFKKSCLGVLSIPRILPRLIKLPSKGKSHSFIFIHEIVQEYISELFKGYPIISYASFRVTRNSNLYLEEETGSLIDAVEAEVHNRRRGDVVRIEIEKSASKKLIDALLKNIEVEPTMILKVDGPVNLNRLSIIANQVKNPALKFPPMHAAHQITLSQSPDTLFKEIRTRDILLHHPYDSYDPVVNFIQYAAEDPNVQVIKQTLYRTNEDSPIIFALLEAAEAGKEVVAVVELKARFDEKSNIKWARQLEEKGVTVVFGLVGLKTHCKLSLAIRKEGNGVRQYVHIGTGNYNPDTAKRYTDVSLFTSNPEVTNAVFEIFNFLTSQTQNPDFKNLQVGPINFLSETLRLSQQEEKNASEGKPSGITAKMNALYDKEIIEALYLASQAGVPIRLLVRGICSLRPGIKGLSENIQVKSLVGRLLEHSRIFHFENNGDPLAFIGSGDWMVRNLRERVEACVPIKDPNLIQKIEDILSIYWADNVKNRIMQSDGKYILSSKQSNESAINAQSWFIRRATNPGIKIPKIEKPIFKR